MGADRTRRFGRAWFRAVAWACALVLALGSVPVHAPGDQGHVDALGAVGAVGDETVFACLDDHPRTPHVEEARPVQRPACPACLHRLENRGWMADAAPRASVVADSAPALSSAPAAVPRSDLERPAPRGPPLA